MDHLEKILSSSGNRLTEPRRQIFETLEKFESPISLQELMETLKHADRTSVFRTLKLFSELEIVEIVYVGWKKRYELASPFRPHHHHLQCTYCHELVRIDEPDLEGIIERFARSYNYELTSHHIELFGKCARCRKAPEQMALTD